MDSEIARKPRSPPAALLIDATAITAARNWPAAHPTAGSLYPDPGRCFRASRHRQVLATAHRSRSCSMSSPIASARSWPAERCAAPAGPSSSSTLLCRRHGATSCWPARAGRAAGRRQSRSPAPGPAVKHAARRPFSSPMLLSLQREPAARRRAAGEMVDASAIADPRYAAAPSNRGTVVGTPRAAAPHLARAMPIRGSQPKKKPPKRLKGVTSYYAKHLANHVVQIHSSYRSAHNPAWQARIQLLRAHHLETY